MSDRHRPWLEGFVIVVSILLAFGIDAGWAEIVERREESQLLESIRSDVVATREEIASHLALSEVLAARARRVLEALAAHQPGRADTVALGQIGSVFVTGGWQPVNHAYTEALSSGRLRLIEAADLRLGLARYQEALDELDDMFTATETQYYAQLEPFLVAHTVYSEIGAAWWRDSFVQAPFRTDFEALGQSRELWNLLTLRLEIEVAVQDRLVRLDERTRSLLERLPEQR